MRLQLLLKTFICMERSACHKMFLKRTKCQYFEHSPRDSETVPDSFGGHSPTKDSSLMLYKACLLSKMQPVLIWSEWNVPSVELVFVLSVRSRAVSSQLCLHETIDYSISNCCMNIKMKSIIINFKTNSRHANHSAAFVCDSIYQNFITFLLLVDVCFPVTLYKHILIGDYFPNPDKRDSRLYSTCYDKAAIIFVSIFSTGIFIINKIPTRFWVAKLFCFSKCLWRNLSPGLTTVI